VIIYGYEVLIARNVSR